MRALRTPVWAAAVAALLILAIPAGATGAPGPVRPSLPAPDLAAAAALDFGTVEVGVASTPLDYLYTNDTGAQQTVAATISGTNAADFAITGDTCSGVPLADGATCTVSVAFTPGGEYGRSATLDISDGVTAPEDVGLTGIGVLAESKVAWGTTPNIGSAYTYTAGAALARTVSGTTQYLHAVVQRYDVSHPGIYYRRSSNGGSRWPVTTRLNPSTQFAGRSAVAAAGSHVYAVWSSLASANPAGSKPRALWFRSNATHGAGTWAAARRLTSATGRIDYPKVAAAGTNVYIAYTDSVTGSVKVRVSHNAGATWSIVTMGNTTRVGTSGRIGTPAVAAFGSTVAVAWVSSPSGTVKFRSSADRGTSWSATSTLGSGAELGSWPTIAALGPRIGVAWTTSSSIAVRIRTGSTWGPVRAVGPSAGSTQDYQWPWMGQVVLNGTAGVGVAFEACWAGCLASDPASAYRSDILWRESADNGTTWARSQVVMACDNFEYLNAYMPSALWPSASTRYVMAGHWYGPNLLDNVVFRAGLGTP